MKSSEAASEPRAAAISFITTEHFTLQGARSATIAESIGRASTFLASVSGGLIAFGLVATGIGGAFYAFGLVLLPSCVIALAGLLALMRHRRHTWAEAATLPITEEEPVPT